jgi:HD-GYP domain-containing protein (c-di-GMP phosphodiesterase class II)
MRELNIDHVRPDMVLEQDIYGENNANMPLLRKGNFITKGYLDKLKERGVEFLYVNEPPSPVFEKGKSKPAPVWKSTNLPYEKTKPILSPTRKKEAIKTFQDLQRAMFRQDEGESGQIFTHMDNLASQLIEGIGTDRNALVSINDLRHHDEHLYHHSMSVAVLSAAIGQYLGYSKEDLLHLSKAALVHDIGKLAIPPEILHKPQQLTQTEMDMVKKHTLNAYNYMAKYDICNEMQRQGIIFHHEKIDGTGYHNIPGWKIPVWSRIIAIADAYDAMTSKRPHRDPIPFGDAIEFIMSNANFAFDYDVVNAFIKRVEVYPVGCFVELSNDQIAVVLGSKNVLRPVIRVLNTNDTVDLSTDRRYLSVVIKHIITYEEALKRT